MKFVEILNRLFTPPLAIWTFQPRGRARSTGPPWTGEPGGVRARRRRGPRRRRHGRGAPARRGNITGHEGPCRGHGCAAHAEASAILVAAAAGRGRCALLARRRRRRSPASVDTRKEGERERVEAVYVFVARRRNSGVSYLGERGGGARSRRQQWSSATSAAALRASEASLRLGIAARV